MTDPTTEDLPSHSGDQAPLLVRLAEKLSKRQERGNKSPSLDRAIWVLVAIQAMQMDTGNLSWLYFLFL